jgi:NAD(P)-dependent dehydrogenase (short-subunit alcohol dehydrogenase family)
MPRTVLVTECDAPLGAAIARLFLARGWRVAGLGAAPGRSGPGPQASLAVAWNRRSPVSAHAAFLGVLNAFDTLDEVLIVEPPAPDHALLVDTPSAAIERALDDVKGPIFLAREALAHFLRTGAGVLSLVSAVPAAGAVAGAARECFRGLAGALLADPGVPGLVVNGFQSPGAELEEYASFVDRTLEEKARKISGRWFSYQPRGGFLQGRTRP